MAAVKDDVPHEQSQDELAESLNDLFSSISTMIKSELQVAPFFSSLSETIFIIISMKLQNF